MPFHRVWLRTHVNYNKAVDESSPRSFKKYIKNTFKSTVLLLQPLVKESVDEATFELHFRYPLKEFI